MSISIFVIKKYFKILSGNSVFTVNQDEGKFYSKSDVKGYYNNLTEKITRFGYPDNELPITHVAKGMKIHFSIEIFQYGLAAFDLFLDTNKIEYLNKFKACVDWTVKNQDDKGRWATFPYKRYDQLYSSMAQGEAISLLTRAYKLWGDEKYKIAAKKSKEFMLTTIDNGGTAVIKDGKIFLYEYLHEDQVLNGWIFSAWGLYDYAKCFNDRGAWNQWENTVDAMAEKLWMYDRKIWSSYTDGKKWANPFYHKLHIAQLNVMYDLTGNNTFKIYADKFMKYQDNRLYRFIAFIYKIWQKATDNS